MTIKLGKLKKVDLREYWKHEAFDFTRWLSLSDNLSELGDELGIEINTDRELVQTESGIGRFSADIIAQELNTGRKLVIENQLEATDHTHLGQILTYAAGIEAEYIVWIVKDARDEHKQAVDWLNEHTDEKINFFLVRIELWQIGESDPAPKFVIVSRPNDWTKSVRGSVHAKTDLSATQLLQLEFWQQLRSFAANHNPPLKLRTPRAQHWYDVAIGRSDSGVSMTVLKSSNQVGCELYIPDSKERYRALYSNKEAIERELGVDGLLNWQEIPEKKASRIRLVKDFNFDNPDKTEAFNWLVDAALKFKKVFAKPWPLVES
jgi:uncharacterized protein DUF4268